MNKIIIFLLIFPSLIIADESISSNLNNNYSLNSSVSSNFDFEKIETPSFSLILPKPVTVSSKKTGIDETLILTDNFNFDSEKESFSATYMLLPNKAFSKGYRYIFDSAIQQFVKQHPNIEMKEKKIVAFNENKGFLISAFNDEHFFEFNAYLFNNKFFVLATKTKINNIEEAKNYKRSELANNFLNSLKVFK